MMSKPSLWVGATALAFFAATALAQGSPPLDVCATMQGRVNPAVLEIWEIGNNAMNDDGALDPALLDNAKWAQLASAAAQLAATGRDMAEAQSLIAATPSNAAVGEGEVTMPQVQRLMDADPAAFRRLAAGFEAHANKLAAAAASRDPVATNELIGGIDAVCEGCHAQFWYASS